MCLFVMRRLCRVLFLILAAVMVICVKEAMANFMLPVVSNMLGDFCAFFFVYGCFVAWVAYFAAGVGDWMKKWGVREEIIVLFWFLCGLAFALFAGYMLGIVFGVHHLGLSPEVSFFLGMLVQVLYARVIKWVMR